MSDVLGNNIKLTLFGESHGSVVGATLSGFIPGVEIDMPYIKNELRKRGSLILGETKRKEEDEIEIVSGVFHNKTTGAPITILIKNNNVIDKDYDSIASVFRPSHADYTAHLKYGGYNDFRGGGHFSGRMTTAIVAVCAIIKKTLEDNGVVIGSRIKQIGNVKDDNNLLPTATEIKNLDSMDFPVFNEAKGESMKKEIESAFNEGDSIGGLIETYVANHLPGLGNPFFDSLESQLSYALFSIPGLKGVNFGLGYDFASAKGSAVNDSLYNANGIIKTKTNNNGGINGGISNGMPLVFTSVIKPTASIFKEQDSVDSDGKEAKVNIQGRHDSCLVRRITPIVNALTAFVLFDNYLSEVGYDFFK